MHCDTAEDDRVGYTDRQNESTIVGSIWANSSRYSRWTVKPIDVVFVVAPVMILHPLSSRNPVFPNDMHPGFRKYGSPLNTWMTLSVISMTVASLFARSM